MTNFHFTRNPFISDELLDACNKDLTEWEEEIRADEKRKFAEWLQSNGYYVYVMSTPDGIYTDEVTVDEIISAYEKEQKNERT